MVLEENHDEFDVYEIPERLYYSKERECLLIKIDRVVVGITDYTQKSLHEIVYLELQQ